MGSEVIRSSSNPGSHLTLPGLEQATSVPLPQPLLYELERPALASQRNCEARRKGRKPLASLASEADKRFPLTFSPALRPLVPCTSHPAVLSPCF